MMMLIMIKIQLIGPNDLFSILTLFIFLMIWLYLMSDSRQLTLKHVTNKLIL